MRFGALAATIIACLAVAPAAYAENDAGCVAVTRFGVYDKFQTLTPTTQYRLLQGFFANNPFTSQREAERQAAASGLDVGEVLGLRPGGQRSEADYIEWADALVHTSYRQAAGLGLKPETVAKISRTLMALFPTCLLQKGLHAYLVPAADRETFSFIAEFVPSAGATKRGAKGYITIGPDSVPDTCRPRGVLGEDIEIGQPGVNLSCRLPADAEVTIWTKAGEVTSVIFYDGHLPPLDDQH